MAYVKATMCMFNLPTDRCSHQSHLTGVSTGTTALCCGPKSKAPPTRRWCLEKQDVLSALQLYPILSILVVARGNFLHRWYLGSLQDWHYIYRKNMNVTVTSLHHKGQNVHNIHGFMLQCTSNAILSRLKKTVPTICPQGLPWLQSVKS